MLFTQRPLTQPLPRGEMEPTEFAAYVTPTMPDEFRRLVGDLLGGLVDLLHQLLDLGAGDRRDLELRLGGVGEEVRVLHGVVERLAQRLGAVLRHTGRRQKRPAHHLPREDQPEDLLLLVGLGEIHAPAEHSAGPGCLCERQLHQDVDRLVVDPALVRRQHARPRPAAAALHLAALHRQRDVVAARIAGDDLELGAEHAVEDARELIGVGRRAGAADDQLLAHACPRAW